jgi:uncharacterized protein (TIRG00374 family)
MPKRLFSRILLSLVFALLVYLAFVLWSDWQQLQAALSSFPWAWLPLAILLTLVNYTGRLLKWHWYLRILKTPIRLVDSARVFCIGMLMVMTPGKAGEFLKSYMVKNVTGTPMSVTAPVVLAERLTDGIAMILLASAGLFAVPNLVARLVAGIILLGFVIGVVIVQNRTLSERLIDLMVRLPIAGRFAPHLRDLYESSYVLFGPGRLILSIAWGMGSWAAEGIAYFVVLYGFGLAATLNHLLSAIFIFSISSVFGAVLATPGGLGAAEGSLVGLSHELLGLPIVTATAAALLIRFCTLWLGVAIGTLSFLFWPQLLAGNGTVGK